MERAVVMQTETTQGRDTGERREENGVHEVGKSKGVEKIHEAEDRYVARGICVMAEDPTTVNDGNNTTDDTKKCIKRK